MTGKAKQVTPVVYELVHVHTWDNGCRSLLGANEIDCQQQKKTAENGPRQKVANRDSDRSDIRCENCISH